MSGINGNGDFSQQLGSANCVGLFDQYGTYRPPTPTLDVAYFLKHANEQTLVDMYKRIPKELRDRVNIARAREKEAQTAYEQCLDTQGET